VSVTPPSTWPWIDHLVSGLHRATGRPIRTRFRYAFPTRLSSPHNVSRWPIMQKVRSHPLRGSYCLYACGFRIYFTPLPGFFSPFPHGTGSLSVPLDQKLKRTGWSDFARHYFRNLGWFLFLWLLRCFSSPGSPPHAYVFSVGYPCGWVSPFGHLRINVCLPTPRSFSQAATSFIACNRQGIHHMHLVAWSHNGAASREAGR